MDVRPQTVSPHTTGNGRSVRVERWDHRPSHQTLPATGDQFVWSGETTDRLTTHYRQREISSCGAVRPQTVSPHTTGNGRSVRVYRWDHRPSHHTLPATGDQFVCSGETTDRLTTHYRQREISSCVAVRLQTVSPHTTGNGRSVRVERWDHRPSHHTLPATGDQFVCSGETTDRFTTHYRQREISSCVAVRLQTVSPHTTGNGRSVRVERWDHRPSHHTLPATGDQFVCSGKTTDRFTRHYRQREISSCVAVRLQTVSPHTTGNGRSVRV